MAKALGKGLSDLLGESKVDAGEGINQVPIESITAGISQPRTNFDQIALDELAQSIAEKGILQPLLLQKAENGIYQIIAGERRWRASRQAGLKEVPAIIKDFSPEESLEIGLIENLQRENLNDIEEAEAYHRLMEEFGYNQNKIATIVGKSRPYIANNLRLNQLPEEVKEYVKEGKLTGSHARALINEEDAIQIAHDIIEKGLNVRQVESLIRNRKKIKTSRKEKNKDADTTHMEKTLISKLGIHVDIKKKRGGNKGIISLSYENIAQLDMILKKLETE